jgi:hypothetical protein
MRAAGTSDMIHIQTKRIQTIFQSFSLYENDSVFLIFNYKAACSHDRMQSDDLISKFRNIIKNKQFLVSLFSRRMKSKI